MHRESSLCAEDYIVKVVLAKKELMNKVCEFSWRIYIVKLLLLLLLWREIEEDERKLERR